MTCPPCTGECRQGRDCNARSEYSDGVKCVGILIAMVVACVSILALLAWLGVL